MIARLNSRFPKLVRIAKFGLVGVTATFVHGFILWLLVEFAAVPASVATVIGFLIAFFVSYFGHYYITFGSKQPHKKSLPAYFATAAIGAGVNFLTFFIMTGLFDLNYWIAFAVVLVTVPPITFTLSRVFAFKPADLEGQSSTHG
ncbi:MAG: GtrA family protein [Pseudomonadota bacterium]